MIQIKNRYTGEVILEVESLCSADLSGADLRKADLRGAYLTDSDLYGADLYGADLRGANLKGANLRDANLRDVNLCNAYLYGVDLSGANLRGANLSGADLRKADLRGACNYYTFIAYDTSKRLVHCVKHDDTWMVLAGCFWGTLEELEKKVLDTHKSPVYLANIEILKTI